MVDFLLSPSPFVHFRYYWKPFELLELEEFSRANKKEALQSWISAQFFLEWSEQEGTSS